MNRRCTKEMESIVLRYPDGEEKTVLVNAGITVLMFKLFLFRDTGTRKNGARVFA